MITCSKCGEDKDEDLFPKRSGTPTGRRGVCRECLKKYRKEYYRKNINRERACRRKRASLYKTDKWSNIKTKYGLSKEEWERMYAEQNGKCYICGEERKLHVDHDHKTGKVRHLLCNSCNVMLGYANDDQEILIKAIHYLQE